jgi:hypothetical protein
LLARAGSVPAAETSLRWIEHILRCHVNQPLRRSWIEHPYGEEEIALLEEEMLPVLQHYLQRIDEIDAELEKELEAQITIEQLRQQLALGLGGEAVQLLGALSP